VQTANFDANDFNDRAQQKADEGLLVKFFVKAIPDTVATAEQGRPIFMDVEYIDIRIPGKRDSICRAARMSDIERFRAHYDAFKNRTALSPELVGTPLIEWPLMTRSQAEEMAFANVKTVEQLVAMSDGAASNFMGLQSLRAKAREWLIIAKEGKAAADMKSELEKRDEEINTLKAQMKELLAQKPKPTVRKKRASKKKTAKKE
jgi:hypothetical protein